MSGEKKSVVFELGIAGNVRDHTVPGLVGT